jgi:hypothetical protein
MDKRLGKQLGDDIPLSMMIEGLRRELQTAMAMGRDQTVQFVVGEAELDLFLTLEKPRDGEVQFWVVTGKDSKRSECTSFRFQLRLQPVSRDGGPLKASDLRPVEPR